jgi:hypothetical protein
VKPVGELVNTPRPGRLVGERIAGDSAARRIGVLEIDALPNYIYDDLAEAAPRVEFVEGASAFAPVRRVIDAAERGLLQRADAIARSALGDPDLAAMANAGQAVAAVERTARLAGAEEAYVHIAPDLAAQAGLVRISGAVPLGMRFAVRASIAYKGCWVRRVRTVARDAADQELCTSADAWMLTLLTGLRPDQPLGAQIMAAAPNVPAASLQGFLAESCVGSYPLQAVATPEADGSMPAGAFVVVTVRLLLNGVPWLGAAPAMVGQP